MSAPLDVVWCAVAKNGRAKFERLAHEAILAVEALENERDRMASAFAAGRFNGPDFSPENREAVAAGIEAVDSAKLAHVCESLVPVATSPDMSEMPVEQDDDFVRVRDALVAAGLSRKRVRRALRAAGWVLE